MSSRYTCDVCGLSGIEPGEPHPRALCDLIRAGLSHGEAAVVLALRVILAEEEEG